ncbi:MAG: helix-turn-helix domain-containing protein [Parcubacteria group bacterium]|jgi:sugar-specific transcriptional regulator TrmB
MYQKQLLSIGLTKTQANTFDFLLENGENKASGIARAVKQPRGAIYKALDELLALELVEKVEKQREIARFRPLHPRKLEKVLEKRENTLRQSKGTLEEILPNLTSAFNLTVNRPGVKFYEGEEGFKKVLYDTLTSKTEVYMIINREALADQEKFMEINEEYKRRRVRAGIKKKILRIGEKLPDETPPDDDESYRRITEIKYAGKKSEIFKASVQIYDNKISYQIIDDDNLVSILVEDKNIYLLLKTVFELLWEKTNS